MTQNEPADNNKGNCKNNNNKKCIKVNASCICIKVCTVFCTNKIITPVSLIFINTKKIRYSDEKKQNLLLYHYGNLH